MHTSTTAGISGGKHGAYSIVMSGGYEDDVDKGDFMCANDLRFLIRFILPPYRIYTGTGGYGGDNRYGGGGRSWNTVQVEDQTFEHKDNEALLVSSRSPAEGTHSTLSQVSCELGKPVRVIRGHGLKSKYAPSEGFVDGDLSMTR